MNEELDETKIERVREIAPGVWWVPMFSGIEICVLGIVLWNNFRFIKMTGAILA